MDDFWDTIEREAPSLDEVFPRETVGRQMKAIRAIYLAGKIAQNDWRHTIVDGLKAPQHGNTGGGSPMVHGLGEPWPILTNAIFDRYHYTGPYFIASDTHYSTFHSDDDSHGVGADLMDGYAYDDDNAEEKYHNTPLIEMKPWVVERCQRAIRESDLVFAWIDDTTCYGTIAELGYAKALGKIIWIAGTKRYRDLWFVYEMADATHILREETPKETLKACLEYHAYRNFSFESPIECAFWEKWFSFNYDSYFPLIPQYQIGKYRVDFAHVATHTAIELDGHATHSSPDAIAYDRKRQREIEEQGWHVIRFGGKEIYSDASTAVHEAYRLLRKRLSESAKAVQPFQ